jgi:hypothetical protein
MKETLRQSIFRGLRERSALVAFSKDAEKTEYREIFIPNPPEFTEDRR